MRAVLVAAGVIAVPCIVLGLAIIGFLEVLGIRRKSRADQTGFRNGSQENQQHCSEQGA